MSLLKADGLVELGGREVFVSVWLFIVFVVFSLLILEGRVEFSKLVVFVVFKGVVVLDRVVFEGLVTLIGLDIFDWLVVFEGLVTFEELDEFKVVALY
jgi:hypothetical protein